MNTSDTQSVKNAIEGVTKKCFLKVPGRRSSTYVLRVHMFSKKQVHYTFQELPHLCVIANWNLEW